MRTLRRFGIALWLAAFVLPGSPVLCIGASGHVEFEFLNDDCCTAPVHEDCSGIEACPADRGCGDCSDISLDRDSLAGRRDAAVALTGATPLLTAVASVAFAPSQLPDTNPSREHVAASGRARAFASTVIRR